jgi:hypothetical protein
MKKLRRRVIIRQYDYHKVVKRAVPKLYTECSFVPITLKELEQEHLLKVLANEKLPEPPAWLQLKYPKQYLYAMKDYLYDEHYVDWFSEYDENGYMWIQAKKGGPETMLGWATFEVEY